MPQKADQEIRILDGSSFYVSDSLGNSYSEKANGLFFKDTRFLSSNVLKINDLTPALLSTKNTDYFSARFFLTLPFNTTFDLHPIAIIRSRVVGRGVSEQVYIENNGEHAVQLMVTLYFDTDFADIFEVKAGVPNIKRRRIQTASTDRSITFTYENDKLKRQTLIEFSQNASVIGSIAYFSISVKPKQSWSLDISVTPVLDHQKHEPKYRVAAFVKARPEMKESMSDWLDRMPVLNTDMDHLKHAYNHSLVDLAALRFTPAPNDESVIAAGLPWFMALFGRDSLITSYQTVFMSPELGRAALASLSARQGNKNVDFTDEQPGRILHELRFDELTQMGKLPYSPYYGSADSTPLFLILLHEIFTWTADYDLVRSLEQHARRALDWIDTYADMSGNGYVEYKTRSSKGLRNQCWKDSGNAIQFANGELAKPPLAVCEVQGYVYDAKMRSAYLAEHVWNDTALAQKLRAQATELKKRFNEDFWTDNRGGYFVLALNHKKEQVDALCSNMGQLLWTGIIDEDKADQVVKQLFSEDLYSGWGVRTMSTQDIGFNPITYHCGTVWPHDNSIICAGLRRYGYTEKANALAMNMIDAAHYFGYCLPEVFAGFSRKLIDYPVEYPTACSPQAWATGSIGLFVRTILGLAANPLSKTIVVDAHLPEQVKYIDVQNLRLFGDVFHIHVTPSGQEVNHGQRQEKSKEHIKRYKQSQAS